MIFNFAGFIFDKKLHIKHPCSLEYSLELMKSVCTCGLAFDSVEACASGNGSAEVQSSREGILLGNSLNPMTVDNKKSSNVG